MSSLSRPVVPVILCGGVGSRLWPVSRDMHPKPFIRLSDGLSLIQHALKRAQAITQNVQPLIVTNEELLFKIGDECEALSASDNPLIPYYILEPFGRNTAPAIGLAALKVKEKYGKQAQLMVMAADHLIQNTESFVQSVEAAAQLAEKGQIVTFGITPSTPETGYGYIEANGNQVTRFVEKPNFDKAVEYVTSGRFLWNSGMFCFSAGAVLEQLQQCAPEMHLALLDCYASMDTESSNVSRIPAATFQAVPDDSFDYAVMEKTDKASVVQCSFGWSDVGCWRSLGYLEEGDEKGNRFTGKILSKDVSNTVISSEHRVVGAIGLQDLLVIDTSDALLVAHKDKAQDVKHVYQQLKEENHEAHKIHRTASRPWGTYTVLEEGKGYKIKRIAVNPHAKLSLQKHKHRSEHWVVVEGEATVTNGGQVMTLKVNESTYIPAGHIHRLENNTDEMVHIIEVQTGGYLGEDDIERFDDQYNRA